MTRLTKIKLAQDIIKKLTQITPFMLILAVPVRVAATKTLVLVFKLQENALRDVCVWFAKTTKLTLQTKDGKKE